MKYVILHNIRSAHNVGSIFRTSDGAGVSKIFLTGYTPAPVDRFGRTVSEIEKPSLGASEIVPWEYCESVEEVLAKMKEDGVTTVAVEQHERAVDYKNGSFPETVAFIFGNEVEGVPESICAQADMVVEIAMAGEKESLNVSVAAGVVLFGRS